ncbi:MAG: ABC transporter permease [Phycisphaeraceae bacterium]|nr:ABC transporter permease [Phycisphaerales bacterium]MCB9861495.1 ABC transporter permease [Phycisphaeraceae bacterium]
MTSTTNNPHASEVPDSVPAIMAPPRERDNPFTRSPIGIAGMVFLALMFAACVLSLPLTLGSAENSTTARYMSGDAVSARLSPAWWPWKNADEKERLDQIKVQRAAVPDGPQGTPAPILGTDVLGRSLMIRVLAGGGISLTIGIVAALISVCIGTVYGSISGFFGGKVDAVMMRIVDILFGLPYILLVVLLAVAVDAMVMNLVAARAEHANVQRQAYVEQELQSRAVPVLVETYSDQFNAVELGLVADLGVDPDITLNELLSEGGPLSPEDRSQVIERLAKEQTSELRDEIIKESQTQIKGGDLSESQRATLQVITLLVAIGGVSWLTMARVVRGQVLSLKNQPFMEAARAIGTPLNRQFVQHLLPNLLGPIIVYATLTVPQAILQESFLSFLGIGVSPPLPSWGNLAAEGLDQLNQHRSYWWLLFFPCLLLGLTLLALNFVGEGLREAFDPKRAKR